MLYVFRSRNSTGARELAEGITLLGTLARRTRGQRLRTLQNGDVVICWGDHFAVPSGVTIKTLNNQAPVSKFREAQILREKGVPTIQVSQTRPAVAAARAAFTPHYTALTTQTRLNPDQATDIANNLLRFAQQERQRRAEYDRTPATPTETWLARRNNHVGGNDLLSNETTGDFYSKKEDIIEEYRLHIFKGKSIRAGKKIQRPEGRPGGGTIHPWIRSFDAGWIIQYDNFESIKAQRDVAVAAVKALDLDFAAVDLGRKADGTYIVLEVNRAPGLEGNTVSTYARKIIDWANGTEPAAATPRATRR